jgi:hypothetical protein
MSKPSADTSADTFADATPVLRRELTGMEFDERS